MTAIRRELARMIRMLLAAKYVVGQLIISNNQIRRDHRFAIRWSRVRAPRASLNSPTEQPHFRAADHIATDHRRAAQGACHTSLVPHLRARLPSVSLLPTVPCRLGWLREPPALVVKRLLALAASAANNYLTSLDRP